MFHGRISLNSVLLLVLLNFVNGFMLELMYISLIPHQVKPHSSSWFSASSTAAIVHRNHFFLLNQQNKSSESKVKFRQANNRCKRVLKAAKLEYANKKKSPSLSRNLALGTFGELQIAFSTKVNLPRWLTLIHKGVWS